MGQSDVNDATSAKVIASIPACLLVASNFHEIVRVHVDQYGHIRGLWYQTMSTDCPKTNLNMPPGPVQLVCDGASVRSVLRISGGWRGNGAILCRLHADTVLGR